MPKTISGFSKLHKEDKIQWIAAHMFANAEDAVKVLKQYWNNDIKLQKLHDDFVENTLSNYYLPFSVVPNVVINNKVYTVPMVIEESSVVAAASLTAKFWSKHGGFKAEVISTIKVGQVHFLYEGNKNDLLRYFEEKKSQLFTVTDAITENMRHRGGGIIDIELRDKTADLANYYQLHITFETADSMGANFINTCLEAIALEFKRDDIQIIMSILSNYVPNCLVRAEVSCKVSDLYKVNADENAQKFLKAVQIAQIEPYRAVTHNKGIMNGIDAVVLATGNDFRAVEAGVHAFAAKNGHYKSLTNCSIENGIFKFWIEVPLALGTVGGLTSLHPLSKFSLEMMQHPSAKELMQIVAVIGLAQNFAALKALTTTGIQHGHMKMHLTNIIKQLNATEAETLWLMNYFKDKTISHNAVREAYQLLKQKNALQ
ncbi:MAG: hydroxymethylglutaryl-CoA reductase, degradative [Flavobacteriaceae bacterium]|jgi:hydroxymethylglutaryl-CoA reductase|nr:hydroxymethylglutaryl-CoA reductase, degradative [Flavobacteriaceae bacterium]